MLKHFVWQIAYPFVTTPDPTCPYGGGILRDSRLARFVDRIVC